MKLEVYSKNITTSHSNKDVISVVFDSAFDTVVIEYDTNVVTLGVAVAALGAAFDRTMQALPADVAEYVTQTIKETVIDG